MSKITTLSIVELVKRIADGSLSAEEVVTTYWNQAQRVNKELNAIAEWNENAIDQAKELDDHFKTTGKVKGPLHGIPFTIKEHIAVEGKLATIGLASLKNNRVPADAVVVKRLKEAGGILLGTTNMMEFGFSFDCVNVLYGRTHNPHDLTRTPGGSSGGCGALVAAGGTPLSFGTDLGGSVRVPAHFNGIMGLKASQGRIPLTGVVPYDTTEFHLDMFVVGPLTKYVEDLEYALEVVSGPDFNDFQANIPRFIKTPFTPTRVAYVLDDGAVPSPHAEVIRTVEKAVDILSKHGVTLTDESKGVFDMSKSVEYLCKGLAASGTAHLWAALKDQTIDPKVEIALKETDKTLPTTREEVIANRKELITYRKTVSNFFANYDALILPPACYPALTPEQVGVQEGPSLLSKFRFTIAFNAAGFPGIVVGSVHIVPDGEFKGLPVGVQIVFPPHREDIGFAVAKILQENIPSTTSNYPAVFGQ